MSGWESVGARSRTESIPTKVGDGFRRVIRWRGVIVLPVPYTKEIGHFRNEFCCSKSHRIKRSAVECAEREARRRNKAAK